MQIHKAQSFKPLTISSEDLPASTARQEALTSYAAERAKLLLGCFRTGEANDPVTYVAAVTAILARYPEEIITTVTHPATGLPKGRNWLPTVKEVFDACELEWERIKQQEAREQRVAEQLAAREAEDAAPIRPTLSALKEKYGDNWGLATDRPVKTVEDKKVENAAALEQSLSRVRAEYAQAGLAPPSKFALSPTALRDIAERDAMRAERTNPERVARMMGETDQGNFTGSESSERSPDMGE